MYIKYKQNKIDGQLCNWKLSDRKFQHFIFQNNHIPLDETCLENNCELILLSVLEWTQQTRKKVTKNATVGW